MNIKKNIRPRLALGQSEGDEALSNCNLADAAKALFKSSAWGRTGWIFRLGSHTPALAGLPQPLRQIP
jgi:hypothetical protein